MTPTELQIKIDQAICRYFEVTEPELLYVSINGSQLSDVLLKVLLEVLELEEDVSKGSTIM